MVESELSLTVALSLRRALPKTTQNSEIMINVARTKQKTQKAEKGLVQKSTSCSSKKEEYEGVSKHARKFGILAGIFLLISVVLPWWGVSFLGGRRNESLFLWGYYASVNGEWDLLVFSWIRLELISNVAASFALIITLLVASLLLIFYGNRRKSFKLIIVGSVLALLAPMLFYSLINAAMNGRPIGSSFEGGNETNWGFSFGFYFTIFSSILGFISAYMVRARIVQTVNILLKTTK